MDKPKRQNAYDFVDSHRDSWVWWVRDAAAMDEWHRIEALPVLREACSWAIHLDYKAMPPETLQRCKAWGKRLEALIATMEEEE